MMLGVLFKQGLVARIRGLRLWVALLHSPYKRFLISSYDYLFERSSGARARKYPGDFPPGIGIEVFQRFVEPAKVGFGHCLKH
jgi:hypothetical protein